MPFKINISHKGKTYKLETESEVIVGKKIGEKIKGEDIGNELDGYELQITGTSDISGIPGFKGLESSGYHRRLLTYGFGMKNRKKGIRLRKTNRGEEISLKTSQVNTILVKEGSKKFESLLTPKAEVPAEEAPKEEKTKEPAPDSSSKKPITDTKDETKEPEKTDETKPVEEPKKEETSQQ